MTRRDGRSQDTDLLSLLHEIQRALDQAEMSHRAAVAAHRQAGDKLLALSNALRSRAVRPPDKIEPAIPVGNTAPVQPHQPPIWSSVPDPVAVSVRDAIRITGLGRSTLYRCLSNGDLAARKAGKRTLIVYSSLRQWMDSLPRLGDK
jgi:excisionase family DNA binding protein